MPPLYYYEYPKKEATQPNYREVLKGVLPICEYKGTKTF